MRLKTLDNKGSASQPALSVNYHVAFCELLRLFLPPPFLPIPIPILETIQDTEGGGFDQGLSAPKSQRFLRFAIPMPIADPRHRSDFGSKTSNAALRFKGAMENRYPKEPAILKILWRSNSLSP